MARTWAICSRELRALVAHKEALAAQAAFAAVGVWASLAAGGAGWAGQAGIPSLLVIVISPWIASRALAHERDGSVLELLASLPVRDWELVVGKFLAVWGWMAAGLAWTLAAPIRQVIDGALPGRVALGSSVALLLLAATMAAVGICCAVLAPSRALAPLLALGLGLALYAGLWAVPYLPAAVVPWLEYLSLSYHQVHLRRGEFDSRDVVYYLTLTVGALAVATSAILREPEPV